MRVGDIERNPADAILSARSKADQRKTAANAKRLPFKVEQLNQILGLAATRSKARALYWTVPGMLLTGARLNEFCQLQADDIVSHNGRLHLSILCLPDETDDIKAETVSTDEIEDQRRVKSAAGRRKIPIHPTLVEMGFLDFVARRQQRHGAAAQLFPELQPDKYGYYSGSVSKAINRLLKKAGAASKSRSAYSFRHNFSDACDAAKIPERTKNKYMGHSISGTPGIYGNPLVVQHESDLIDKITYTGVDFTPYTKRKNAVTTSLDRTFTDALDIVAVRNGDTRLTRYQRDGLTAAGRSTKEWNWHANPPRLQPPSDEEFRDAKRVLPVGIRAFMVAHKVVHGSFPSQRVDESEHHCRLRVTSEAKTREDLWRKAILTGAVFPVPRWVTSAIAQGERFREAPGDLAAQPRIDRAERVHIEGWCIQETGPVFCVIFPRVIDRGEGPYEIGAGKIARRTVDLSRWCVRHGWINGPATSTLRSGSLNKITGAADAAGDDDAAGPSPKPQWA